MERRLPRAVRPLRRGFPKAGRSPQASSQRPDPRRRSNPPPLFFLDLHRASLVGRRREPPPQPLAADFMSVQAFGRCGPCPFWRHERCRLPKAGWSDRHTSKGETPKKEELVLMRRLPIWILASLALAIALPFSGAIAETGVSVGLHIGDRYSGPDLGCYDEPNVVSVPGRTGVYYVQGSGQDVYRYNNNWYMNYNGDWYRANSYSGPFTFVGYRSVPQSVYTVPSSYRRNWSDYRDLHYDWSRSD